MTAKKSSSPQVGSSPRSELRAALLRCTSHLSRALKSAAGTVNVDEPEVGSDILTTTLRNLSGDLATLRAAARPPKAVEKRRREAA